MVLEVRNLQSRRRGIRDVELLRPLLARSSASPASSGPAERKIARAIFGADPIDSGEIFIHGKKVKISGPIDAVRHGIGYLSEDRKRYGLALGLDVETNVVMASLQTLRRSAGDRAVCPDTGGGVVRCRTWPSRPRA